MSNTAASKAATVAARIAGQAATIGAHGVPVGPLVEAVVGELLGELLGVQDEELATLRNIERDVAQLIEGPYRTAREMLEKAMIPGRDPDAVKADLQKASDEFLRAAAQYRDVTLSQASAYMEASLVLGLLGDLSAMRYYGDKAWKEGTTVLYREVEEAGNFLARTAQRPALRIENSFWSRFAEGKYGMQFDRLSAGIPDTAATETFPEGRGFRRVHKTKSLAELYPEAQAIERIHETKHRIEVYRDVAANVADGPDILPHLELYAKLDDFKVLSPYIRVDLIYGREQIESRRNEFASLVGKLGIDDHLYAGWYRDDHFDCLLFKTNSDTDPRVAAFRAAVNNMFPYGLPVTTQTNQAAFRLV